MVLEEVMGKFDLDILTHKDLVVELGGMVEMDIFIMNLIQQLTFQLTQDNIMATFAEIDEETYQVLNVLRVPDNQEHRGQDYLAIDCKLGGKWIQTSINTRAGVHYSYDSWDPSGKPDFKKNYATIGGYYDPIADAFYAAKPIQNPSFILDPETFTWTPPIPHPTELPEGTDPDITRYIWNEEQLQWDLITIPLKIDISSLKNNNEGLDDLIRRYEQQQKTTLTVSGSVYDIYSQENN
jgi:hypothetical protein